MKLDNLFANLPAHPETAERLIPLLQHENIRIEKIVSTGQSSPTGFWYDQPEREWVVLLSGTATLEFADCDEVTPLRPGDFLDIPPHRKHRVAATSLTEPSVWLAIFMG